MSEEKNLSLDKNEETSSPAAASPKKKGITSKAMKVVMWILLCLLLLVILIPLLIYLPPVQRFAVDKASEWLSEETGMDVSVGKVSLGFPLDLNIGDVLAMEDGDTVVWAEYLDVSIEALPLLSGKVVVANLELDNADLNTKSLIEALSVEGHVGTLSLNADEINLSEESGIVNHVLLKDTDLTITLADSVAEDTTEKTPSKWKFQLDDVQTQNVRLTLNLAPRADSTSVSIRLGDGQIKGIVDTGTNQWNFPDIKLRDSSAAYRTGSNLDLNADFKELRTALSLNLDNGDYKLDGVDFEHPDITLASGTDMTLNVAPERITLDGDLNVGGDDLQFSDIVMTRPDIRLEQRPDMTLTLESDTLTLDGHLNTENNSLALKDVNLKKADIALKNGSDMTLKVDVDNLTLDGNLDLDTSVYDFNDILLNSSSIALKQSDGLKLDVDVDKAYLNGSLDLERNDFGFSDIVLNDTKMQMKQGKELQMDVRSKAMSLDADFDLDHSKFRFDDVRMKSTKMDMQTGDGLKVKAELAKSSLNGTIDLDNEKYSFDNVKLTGSKVAYDADNSKPSKGFDPSHIAMTDLDGSLKKVEYGGDGSLRFDVNHLSGKERSGLTLQDSHGTFTMDSKQIKLNNFHVRTPNSTANLSLTMDNDAFDTPARGKQAGKLKLDLDGTFGKRDLALVATEFNPDFAKTWPQKPLKVKANAEGTMQHLHVKNLEAQMNGVMNVKGEADIRNLTSGDMAIDTRFDAKISDTKPLQGFLPADMQKDFSLPDKIDLSADVCYGKNGLNGKVHGYVGNTRVDFDGKVGMDSEDYDVAANLHGFKLRDLMPDGEDLELTGYVKAKGHGFDPYASTTVCDATLNLDRLRYDHYDLQNITGTVGLRDSRFDVDLSIDDPKLITSFTGNGKLQKSTVDADLDINLRHADLAALGLYDGQMELSTDGRFSFTSDLDHLFKATAQVDSLKMVIDGDSLTSERLDLFAETTEDRSLVNLKSGDLKLNFEAPENMLTLIDRYEDTGETAMRFAKMRKLNLNYLKRHLPTSDLNLEMGSDNPLAQFLKISGTTFGQANMELHTDSVEGVRCQMAIDNLVADSIHVETARLNLTQDSTKVKFASSLTLPDQAKFSGFSLTADGFAKMDEAEVELKHFDQKGRMGVDLGVHLDVTDSTFVGRILPSSPTLAYAKFKLNDDNIVVVDTLNHVALANIHMESQEDSCQISLTADTLVSQDISLLIKNVDLAKVSKFIPGMRPMAGQMGLEALYDQSTSTLDFSGNSTLRGFQFDGTPIGNLDLDYAYEPMGDTLHKIHVDLDHEGRDVLDVEGVYDTDGEGSMDVKAIINALPLELANPFIPDQLFTLDGHLGGNLNVTGDTDHLKIDGQLVPDSMVVNSDIYSVNMKFEDKPITVEDSRVTFDNFKIYGGGTEPLTLSGWVDVSEPDDMELNLSLYAKGFNLIDAPRTKRSMVFGKMDGDFLARVHGTLNDLSVRGLVKILPTTDMTYIMTNTPLSIDYRLSDIVTFVDFSQPPSDEMKSQRKVFTGLDLLLNLVVENGAQFHCEFSADKQSYIDVEGEGSFNMTYTPEGTLSLIGRYTIDEGKMKYTLPVIPLKTFNIEKGSYVEFTGKPGNPTLNFAANEETTATVSEGGQASRSVKFKTGLEVKGTLEQMELLFTIDAPEDLSVKNELENMSLEERNKLAVAMLCTGMYLSSNNSSGFKANNALNSFLQNEINNIAGKALNSAVNVDMGLEQTTRDDGTTRTDYSFKFSRRFFNNRLNVIVGGKVSTDGSDTQNESGAYIDDVSLEWRLNEGGTRYVRLFHERTYENLFEGEITSNGVAYIIRKKLDKISDIWKKKALIK